MKKVIRNIFIILTIIWMITIFVFSNQASNESKNTSSFITKKVVKTIYGDTLSEKEYNKKVEEWDYIVRKFAHYTIYLCGGIIMSITIQSYDVNTKKKVFITQGMRKFLCYN